MFPENLSVNISQVTVNCFLFDVIVFAMLPAHGIWRETVSLLSCDNELANEKARCSGKNASYVKIQLKIFRIPLFSRGEYSHSLITFRRIFLIIVAEQAERPSSNINRI